MKLLARGPTLIYSQAITILAGSGFVPNAITLTFARAEGRMVLIADGDKEGISLLRDGLSRGGAVTYMEITGPHGGL